MQHLAITVAAFRCVKASVSTLIRHGVNSKALIMCRMMLDDWICHGEVGLRTPNKPGGDDGVSSNYDPPSALKAPDPNPFSKT